MSLKRPRSSSSASSIYVSSSIEDRKSTFLAHYSPSPTADVRAIQNQTVLKTASHRVAAWRIPSTQQTLDSRNRIYKTGYDDDGENNAGRKLLRVLEETDVVGAVVVARWYGGILLGPVRFTHIERCAQDVISTWKHKQRCAESENPKQKAQKIVDDKKEKNRLTHELIERDGNIVVLRELLRDTLAKKLNSPGSRKTQTPTKIPDYNKLGLEALIRLNKAKDATITWLLKEIEEAESSLQIG
ncbi:ribosomal protein S5 domain 2-like protein [Patellaria atrata CBS 101060]|uniref:Ribosomal protein S5 domain 2-like protein n=1 Tax=Patellaria atrata CBS 101060 TaxID=1346257 RepID=A0A9P4S3M5_9PEZI|nr:ribosomal protein S5 domain 2-like protein [Patellaria atrata CBS 101060]